MTINIYMFQSLIMKEIINKVYMKFVIRKEHSNVN